MFSAFNEYDFFFSIIILEVVAYLLSELRPQTPFHSCALPKLERELVDLYA